MLNLRDWRKLALCLLGLAPIVVAAQNSTTFNPILPGFYPDPSCIFVPEWNDTFFCVTSSFNAFPGIPIHASKDLQNWKLIGNALNRPEQLPGLAVTNKSTSGIWAPTIRFHDDKFYVVTTLVFDNKTVNDTSKWDNFILQSVDPYESSSWSDAVHFPFQGYDTEIYWHENGQVYVTGSHYHQVKAGIQQTTINLDTGELGGNFQEIWLGTGGRAIEGPHIYRKDGYYYLLVAEGGTGKTHMVTMARSLKIEGPYEGTPSNPVLTNANTTAYFQTVGHADIFQDASGNWWSVALSTRSGPVSKNHPMGRETVMVPVTWTEGEFPIWTNVTGQVGAWPLPPADRNIPGSGNFAGDDDEIDFTPGSSLPLHFLHWRFPRLSSFEVSPPERPYSLRLSPSTLNLTGLDGVSASSPQSFVGRRQTDTLFTYSVELSYNPNVPNEEAGVTVFLTQDHHIRLGITLLSTSGSSEPVPHFIFYAISVNPMPGSFSTPVPVEWRNQVLALEVKASNATHYSFSAGPAGHQSLARTLAYADNSIVSYGFTGALVGIYATSNGGIGTKDAYFSKWRYRGQGQFRD